MWRAGRGGGVARFFKGWVGLGWAVGDRTWRPARGPRWLLSNNHSLFCIKPQFIPNPGKCLLRNDHRGPRLAKYDWGCANVLLGKLDQGGGGGGSIVLGAALDGVLLCFSIRLNANNLNLSGGRPLTPGDVFTLIKLGHFVKWYK